MNPPECPKATPHILFYLLPDDHHATSQHFQPDIQWSPNSTWCRGSRTWRTGDSWWRQVSVRRTHPIRFLYGRNNVIIGLYLFFLYIYLLWGGFKLRTAWCVMGRTTPSSLHHLALWSLSLALWQLAEPDKQNRVHGWKFRKIFS